MPSYTLEYNMGAGGDCVEMQSTHTTLPWQDIYDGTGGATVSDQSSGDRRVGQYTSASNEVARQVLLKLDTSSIPDTETVTAVTFRSTDALGGAGQTDDWSLEFYSYDWGGTFDTTDWRTSTWLAAATMLGSITADDKNVGTGNQFDVALSGDNFTWVNKTGTTYLVIASSRNRTATAPLVDEYGEFKESTFLIITTVTPASAAVQWTPRHRRAGRSLGGW